MALLYDDNFQGYTLGQHPPYANLSGSSSVAIVAGGAYGDTYGLSIPANAGVTYPILPSITLPQAQAGVTYTSLGVPSYSALSASFSLKLSNTSDVQGQIVKVDSSLNPFAGVHVAGVRILTDGTVAIVAPASSAFATPQAISDYALHTNCTYWFQINMTFGSSGGFVTANMEVAVNGITIVSSSWTTGQLVSGLPVLYWNNVTFGGAGQGVVIDRLSLYDTAQTIPSYTHPGTPVAFVDQGVIELIKSATPPALDIVCPSSSASFGVAYDSFFTATGGTPPYTWSIIAGSLPPGLTLNSVTGELSGAPTASGTFAYTVQVTDFLGNTHTQSCSIVVAALGSCIERFGPKIYFWEPSFLNRPEDTFLRATDWDNIGYEGMKFIQGVIVEADTGGVTRQIKIQGDQQDIETISINHDGQLMNAYSLTTPYEAHMVRVIPQDVDFWRLFGLRWVYEPAPEYVYEWKTQGTDHDLPGYQFLKSFWIAHRSTVDITFTVNVDGTDFVYTIPNSGGVYKKTYLLAGIATTGKTTKGKLFTYELRSSDVTVPFQLFAKDCEVKVHTWSGGDYTTKLPFGDIHRVSGARL
jgi:hypothetical protein